MTELRPARGEWQVRWSGLSTDGARHYSSFLGKRAWGTGLLVEVGMETAMTDSMRTVSWGGKRCMLICATCDRTVDAKAAKRWWAYGVLAASWPAARAILARRTWR